MKNKILRRCLIALGIIVAVVVILLGCVRLGEKLIYKSFYDNADQKFKMPGTSDNLVQQGFDYVNYNGDNDTSNDFYLVAGYMSDDTASMVYVLDTDGNIKNKVRLKKADGSDYTGHTGGIECYGNYVYITDGDKDVSYDGGLDVFPLDQILNDTEALCAGRVKTYNNPAFCHIYKNYMLVGEYYKEVDYETLDSHRIETPAGDNNTALIMVFELDNSEEFKLSKKPVAAITTTNAIQGLTTIGNEQIVLSSSWGLSTSNLYFYDMSKINTTNIELVSISGNDESSTEDDLELKVYHLDSASLVNTVEAPPMAEEMVCLNNELYILNESACNKYIFGKFMSGNYIYAYDVSYIYE